MRYVSRKQVLYVFVSFVAFVLSCGGGDGPDGSGNGKICSEERCTLGNCRLACLATGPDDPCCEDPACVKDEICVGRTYTFSVSDVRQEPSSCLIPQLLLPGLIELLASTSYPVVIPHRTAFPTSIELDVPLIGPLSVDARLVGESLVFDPVDLDGIDLSEIDPEQLNCIVGGKASGETTELGLETLDVTVRISEITVEKGPGDGECVLGLTQPSCQLTIVSTGMHTP